MNHFTSFKRRLAAGVGFAVAVAAVSGLFLPIVYAGGDGKSDKTPEKSTEPQKLSGSDLYAIHCNRCHAERYPKEFQSSQWKTLLTHMRVRANLPASQAKEILKYLQEESGN